MRGDERRLVLGRVAGPRAAGRGVLAALLVLAGLRAGAATVVEFPIPTVGAAPRGVAWGPDGNLWFAESAGNAIGRMTPAGVVTEFPLPNAASTPHAITVGPDGNLWFTEEDGNRIGVITPAGQITEFTLPTAGSVPFGIAVGSDGNLWFTEYQAGKIGRITVAGAITEFTLPTTPLCLPKYITAGPDGNLWFTQFGANRIGRITTAGVATDFFIPTGSAVLTGIATGPDGNLWFAERLGNKIGRITPAGIVTEFAIPTAASFPEAIAAGADGDLWFSEWNAAKIGRITTAGVITEFALPPSAASAPDGITTSPDGNVWFAEYHGQKIGRLNPAVTKGDFDGDGRPDLVFRDLVNGARNKLWLMNGVARVSETNVVPDAPSADWRIRGTADFDSAATPGSGRDFATDLVFWNQVTGAVEFWLLNGATRVGLPLPLSGAAALPPNWDLSATAEFSHDGKPDIVWRDFTTQQIVIWTMNGAVKTGQIVPNPSQAVDSNWIVVAAADYNADGQTDFLWYNYTSGKIVTWYMDANVVRTAGQFTTPANAGDANWKVVASADLSGTSGPGTPPAGSPDIVWRNETSGNQVVWHMDFASTRVTGEFTNPTANANALDWTIAGPR